MPGDKGGRGNMRAPAVEKKGLTWEACPVTSSFVRHLTLEIPEGDFMYANTLEHIQNIANDHPHAVAGNRSTQMYRAFYCLGAMSNHLGGFGNPGSPNYSYTWTGLTKYIEDLREIEKRNSVQSVMMAFELKKKNKSPDPSPFAGLAGEDEEEKTADRKKLNASQLKLRIRRTETSAAKARVVLEAAEYLRPKLRNGECVGRMGALMAKAFLEFKVPSLVMENCVRELLNINRAPMDWNSTGGESGG